MLYINPKSAIDFWIKSNLPAVRQACPMAGEDRQVCGVSFKVITDFGKIWFKAIYVKETMASTKAFIV